MKIAFLSYYSGNVNRGVETYVHELSNGLSGLGHQVTVFQTGPSNHDSKYQTITIKPTKNDVMSFTWSVLQQIDNSTEILIPTNGRWQSILCKVWTIINNRKIVISGQSGIGFDDRLNLFTFPNVFVGLTKFQSQWAKSVNPLIYIKTIPNGVNLGKFAAKIAPMKFDLPTPIIMSVGALEKNKRHELVIKAVSNLKSGSLVIVGSGSEQQTLEKLGTQLLPNRFKIISCPHEQMPSVYAAANLLTFPTVSWESFGIVLVEAMASGLPIVASDDPIRQEIIGPSGVFVNPVDAQKYSQALSLALDKNWGSTPKNQAAKFSWDHIAKDYEELFFSLYKNK